MTTTNTRRVTTTTVQTVHAHSHRSSKVTVRHTTPRDHDDWTNYRHDDARRNEALYLGTAH
jgi:hypothetical protein